MHAWENRSCDNATYEFNAANNTLCLTLIEMYMWKKLNVDDGPSPRAAHTMCVINKSLVIFGGRDSQSRQHDLYIFDLG